MITLTVITGPEKGRKHQLPDDQPLRIGRRHGDVPLDDRAVSKEHARLEPGSLGTWSVTDLGSANGTWVNGRRITGPTEVSNGDKLQIGRSVLAFKHVAGAAPAEPRHSSDDTHHTADALHHALQLQQEHTQALEEIRRHLEAVTQELRESNQLAVPALTTSPADNWAASARSAIAAEIGGAVAELGRRLDAIEKRIQQAADTAKAESTSPASHPADAQFAAAVGELRQAMQQLPAQLDARPALQQVLAAVERISPPDHAADFAALREAVAAATDQSQQRQMLEQVLAAVNNLKLPEMPAMPAVPDHRADLAALREAIDGLAGQIPPPVDHTPQLQAIHAAVTDSTPQAAIEQKLADLTEAVRFAGDHRAVLESIDTVRGAVVDLPGVPQFQQVLEAVAALKDPSLAARLDELLARPAAEEGVGEALQALRSVIEALPKPIDPTPALTQQLADLREALTARLDVATATAATASSASQPLLAQILETITAPAVPQTDPALITRLDAMQQKIAGIPAVDIAPVEAQIAQLASHLDTLKPQPDPRIEPRLDELLQAVDGLRTALTQQQSDRELAALMAAAQQESAAAAKSDGLIEAMMVELSEKIETLRPEVTHHTLTQILSELRNRPEPAVAVLDAEAKQPDPAAAQATLRPVIDMLHEIATEMSHWPKRQERVLGELYAAMRDLQLQQEQHADRLLRLAEHIDTPGPGSPRRAPGLAATSRAERDDLADFPDVLPEPVAIERRQPSMILTVAVVFFIVVMTFMAIAGTTQWL